MRLASNRQPSVQAVRVRVRMWAHARMPVSVRALFVRARCRVHTGVRVRVRVCVGACNCACALHVRAWASGLSRCAADATFVWLRVSDVLMLRDLNRCSRFELPSHFVTLADVCWCV